MSKIAKWFAFGIAVALLAATQAYAQSSAVQIYGILDAGVEVNKTGAPNTGRNYFLNTGNLAASKLGFRGSEDLGGGLKAVFNLEMGIYVDTGATVSFPDEPSSFFARRSVVGLQSEFGDVYLGRDLTPAFRSLLSIDRFRMGLPGHLLNASQISTSRASNGIFYTTPSAAGVTGRFALTAGTEGTTPAPDQGRIQSAAVDFRRGDLVLTAAYLRRRDLVPGSTTSTTYYREGGFGGEYKAGAWTFDAGGFFTDPVTATANAVDKSKAAWLGVGLAFGVSEVNVQVTRTNVDVVGRGRGRATTFGVEYLYALSKRTWLYAALGGVNNSENARLVLNTGSQRVGGVVFGADPRATLVGVSHSF